MMITRNRSWLWPAAVALLVAGASCTKSDSDSEAEASTETETEASAETESANAGADDAPPATQASGDAPSLADAVGTYEVDPSHSMVVFEINHFGASRMPGLFTKVEGALEIAEDPADSSIELVVDPASVYTADKKRDDHLKSPDFFNVKQFPEITFESTDVAPQGDGLYEVTGDLTLHGETQSVTGTFEHVGAGPSPMDDSMFLTGFNGTLTIDRSDFGMDHMVPTVGDEVKLTVNVEAIK